jgi:hypothetical protein
MRREGDERTEADGGREVGRRMEKNRGRQDALPLDARDEGGQGEASTMASG